MIITAKPPYSAEAKDAGSHWLKRYYGVRALVSFLWVALAFTIGKAQPAIGAALLVAYPAWDCLANLIDARRSGGLLANPSQFLNVVVSAIVMVAVIATVGNDLHASIGVIGVWATLSGLLQLATGVRRWRSASAQWPQILSGAQSTLAGAHFLVQATNLASPVSVAIVAPYAAFGAVYFTISAVVLALKRR
ncbi:DUF308 domain-containing protein [Sphingomonas sp.]|uniref:DUF308 domain-containing protein n=1 Tax=Sphingomonas sp. TaxID=28214 RepID=UPI003B3B833D